MVVAAQHPMPDAARTSPGTAAAPGPEGIDPAAILARAPAENFRVASRLLPAAVRADLMHVYGFARLTDDLGDEWPGDRLAALAWLDRELSGALRGSSTHPLLVDVAGTVRRRGLDPALLRDLIDANRQDQIVSRYATVDDLVDYCSRSANPVGRLVLGLFEVATPERVEWSDRICTGLQLAEHCQDVAEDARAGRIYLPREDLEHFGVSEQELVIGPASDARRALLAFEVARARDWLWAGAPLIGSLRGRVRIAVAGFVAGGMAALDAIGRAGFDVTDGPPRPRPSTVLHHLVRLAVSGGERV